MITVMMSLIIFSVFTDFQSPYSVRFNTVMKQVVENYPNDVKWIFKHFPLESMYSYDLEAAEAVECAGDQNKFWEYTDVLLDNYSGINSSTLDNLAVSLRLNLSQFKDCRDSDKYINKINADSREGASLGVKGVPTSFINGSLIGGAVTYEVMKDKIDSVLNSTGYNNIEGELADIASATDSLLAEIRKLLQR